MERLEAWDRHVAMNVALNGSRRARRALTALARHGPHDDVSELSPSSVAVMRGLHALTPRSRQVVVLHHAPRHPVAERRISSATAPANAGPCRAERGCGCRA